MAGRRLPKPPLPLLWSINGERKPEEGLKHTGRRREGLMPTNRDVSSLLPGGISDLRLALGWLHSPSPGLALGSSSGLLRNVGVEALTF